MLRATDKYSLLAVYERQARATSRQCLETSHNASNENPTSQGSKSSESVDDHAHSAPSASGTYKIYRISPLPGGIGLANLDALEPSFLKDPRDGEE